MASLFKDQNKISAYRDRRFSGTQEEFEELVDMVETIIRGDLTAMAEITLVNDTGEMTMGFRVLKEKEKNPRFGESGDSDDDEEDPKKFS